MSTKPNRPLLAVYTIVERSDASRKHWVRIGTAYENRDGSLNVRLDALPTNGAMHIRERAPAELPANEPTLPAEVAS